MGRQAQHILSTQAFKFVDLHIRRSLIVTGSGERHYKLSSQSHCHKKGILECNLRSISIGR
jgi:hypothetical protein